MNAVLSCKIFLYLSDRISGDCGFSYFLYIRLVIRAHFLWNKCFHLPMNAIKVCPLFETKLNFVSRHVFLPRHTTLGNLTDIAHAATCLFRVVACCSLEFWWMTRMSWHAQPVSWHATCLLAQNRLFNPTISHLKTISTTSVTPLSFISTNLILLFSG